MLWGKQGSLPGHRLGGSGAALVLWDYPKHGKKRGGLKVNPLSPGRDLRKEGGKDNLPEGS